MSLQVLLYIYELGVDINEYVQVIDVGSLVLKFPAEQISRMYNLGLFGVDKNECNVRGYEKSLALRLREKCLAHLWK